jgi:5-methylcytosine-specific restriction endonuclease McrA
MKTCPNCLKDFVSTNVRKKYCCKACWTKYHIKQVRELSLASYFRMNKRFCKKCGKEFAVHERTNNKSFGKRYCQSCSNLAHKEAARKWQENARKCFREMKEEIGCQRCGYNRYGGALDFHHKKPSDKKMRITAQMFHTKHKQTMQEVKKCIVLCRNCHAELHGNFPYSAIQRRALEDVR